MLFFFLTLLVLVFQQKFNYSSDTRSKASASWASPCVERVPYAEQS